MSKNTVIKNRFSKIKAFLELEEAQKNKIIDAFKVGYFYWSSDITKSAGTTFIRAKGEVLDMNKYSDSCLVFWLLRILGKPVCTIIVNK